MGEKNKPEIMIPLDPARRIDAMKLLALAGRKLMPGGSDKGIIRPNQLPNVSGGLNDDGSKMDKVIATLLEQNKILMQLLQKDSGVYLDGDALVGGIGNSTDAQLGKSSKNNMFMKRLR